MHKYFISLCLSIFFTTFSFAGDLDFKITPYIQETTDTGVKIRWERELGPGAIVRVGKLNSDNEIEFKSALVFKDRFRLRQRRSGIYEAEIEGLLPSTSYYYQILLGEDQSSIYNFKTLSSVKEDFSFLVLADAQHGFEITEKIVSEGVIYHTFSNNPDKATHPPRFVLFPGDLVQHGILKHQWKKHFFVPMAPLLHRLAVYPTKGNHEMGKRYFNKYFSLPRNTSVNPNYNYYFFDYSGVRFINLDTNIRYRNKKQLNWLKEVLKQALMNEDVHFVVLQFHHPYKSEAWPVGNTKFTGEIEDVLTSMENPRKTPIVYFNGHTHAYSRGHHQNARLTMITAGPIGGAIDDWDRRSRDYLDYQKTVEQYGWVKVNVTTKTDWPYLEIIRYGFGDKNEITDKGIVDRYKIFQHAVVPETPVVKSIRQEGNSIQLETSNFEVENSEEQHLSTEVKIITSSKRGKTSEETFIFHRENFFNGKNNLPKDLLNNLNMRDLTKFSLQIRLGRNEQKTIQVHYRTTSLAWSSWSEERIVSAE